ncbi:FkbM family methyltransferase [Cupriavidus basilensis]
MAQANNTLVSIGVRAAGSPEKLAAMLRNVQAQTHSSLEIIVSDDVTPGPAIVNLLREVSAADPRIKYSFHSSRRSRYHELKHLLSLATGEFIAWANDGVTWEPGFIERCLEQIEGHFSVMCGVAIDGTPLTMPVLGANHRGAQNVRSFLCNPTLAPWLGLHRRAGLMPVLDEAIDEAGAQIALLRLIRQGRIKTFAEVLCSAGSTPEPNTLVEKDCVSLAVAELGHAVANPGARQATESALRSEFSRHLGTLWWERAESARFCGPLARSLRRHSHSNARPIAPEEDLSGRGELDCGRQAFSQSGEDMIADFVFGAIQHGYPTYLDLGAHHPRRYSNTQFFYLKGCRGVNVEADPGLFESFLSERPLDINLNIGVGVGESGILPFYVMSTPTLNTFSREEAERCAAMGTHRIERVIDVPLMGVNDIIEQHFYGMAPDFLSVDVEGLDLEIIKSIDLQRYRPIVICVETITFSENFDGKK